MMNGMMMQQMQAQQMQAAQMAAMVKGSSGDEPRRRDYDGCGQGSCPAVQGSTTVTVRGELMVKFLPRLIPQGPM